MSFNVYYLDAFYDNRGITFPLNFFLKDGGLLTSNRRNANLVSKTDASVYLVHEILFIGCNFVFKIC